MTSVNSSNMDKDKEGQILEKLEQSWNLAFKTRKR